MMSDVACRRQNTTKTPVPGVFARFWADTSGAVTVDWTVVTGAVVGIAATVAIFVSAGSEAKTEQVNDMLIAASEFDHSFEKSGASSGPSYPTSDSNGDDPENPANSGSDYPGSGSSSESSGTTGGTSGETSGSSSSGSDSTPTADSDQGGSGGTQTNTDGSQQTASTSGGSTSGSTGSSTSGGSSGGGSSTAGAAPAIDPSCYNKKGNIKKKCKT